MEEFTDHAALGGARNNTLREITGGWAPFRVYGERIRRDDLGIATNPAGFVTGFPELTMEAPTVVMIMTIIFRRGERCGQKPVTPRNG